MAGERILTDNEIRFLNGVAGRMNALPKERQLDARFGDVVTKRQLKRLERIRAVNYRAVDAVLAGIEIDSQANKTDLS